MEGRGIVATHDPISNHFTVWSATQSPFIIRRALVDMFDVESAVRVIAPKDVGGGLARKGCLIPKMSCYPPWPANLADRLNGLRTVASIF